MSRNNISKKVDTEIIDKELFDFFETSASDEMLSGMVHSMMETCNKQISSAIELTKVVVDKIDKKMTEDEIFDIFKKASVVISENSQIKKLLDKFETEIN